MKRIMLGMVFLAFWLTACGAKQPAGKFSFMVFGDVAEQQAYQTLVDAFQRQNPQVDVELIYIPGQSDYRKRLSADFAAGTPADVVLMNYRRFAAFAAKNALEPLGPYLEKSQAFSAEDFYPETLEPFHWRGELYCIPQNSASLVVYYNKALFDQAGLAYPASDWTWEQFLQTAQALTRDIDGDGKTDQYGLGTEVTFIRLAPFIWQNGGEVVNMPQNPTQLMLESPEALEAWQWFVDLQVKYHVVPSAEDEAAEDSESRFMNGRVGMYLNSRRVVPSLREITAFDWDVAALPRQAHIANVLHSDGYCMPAAVKDKELVWKFIEFANAAEGQKIIVATGRTVPSLKAVAESPAFLDPNAKPLNGRAYLDMLPYMRAMPVSATWVDVEEVLDAELQRAFYGQASVAEAVQTAIARAQAYLLESEP